MLSLADYLEKAKEHSGLRSYNEINFALGFRGTTVSQWRTGRTLPDDESMIRLAKLAGLDPAEALVNVSIWRARAKHQSIAEQAWLKVAQRLLPIAILAPLAFNQVTDIAATSATSLSPDISIMRLSYVRGGAVIRRAVRVLATLATLARLLVPALYLCLGTANVAHR